MESNGDRGTGFQEGNESTTEKYRRKIKSKQVSNVQTWESDVKPGSQDTIAEKDCSIKKSKKTFFHENLEIDCSRKTGNSKSILVVDERNQMTEMTK